MSAATFRRCACADSSNSTNWPRRHWPLERTTPMHKTIFHAVPTMPCHCPAKTFRKAKQALAYARNAANTFRVSYAVWRLQGGRIRILKRGANDAQRQQDHRRHGRMAALNARPIHLEVAGFM